MSLDFECAVAAIANPAQLFKTILLDFFVERRAVDVELAGCLTAVPLIGEEGGQQDLPLRLGHGAFRRHWRPTVFQRRKRQPIGMGNQCARSPASLRNRSR